MIANVFGTTPEERAHALVMRLPVLPMMLSPEDPARIVAELLENQPEDDVDSFCIDCGILRDDLDELNSDNIALESFAASVRSALGCAAAMDLDEVLAALKARIAIVGEGA